MATCAWDASGKCEGESTLTAEGKSQAKRIGVAFAEHGIRPTVISSPMCRCTETAQIAFGKYSTDPDLRQKPTADALGQEMFQARASELLRQNRGNAPIVFVNHRPNIDSLTMELIDIGELLIGSVTEDGEVEVIGKNSGRTLDRLPEHCLDCDRRFSARRSRASASFRSRFAELPAPCQPVCRQA